MSEDKWDDSYLMTEENLSNIDYDNLDTSGLPVAEDIPCVVDSVRGKRGDFDDYSCGVAVIKWKCFEGPYKGRTKIESIRLHHPKEPDWCKNKRLVLLTKLGVISKGDHDAAKKINWKADLEGRKAFITTEESEYEDKKTKKKKKGINIAFAGYKPYDGTSPATQSQDSYNDI